MEEDIDNEEEREYPREGNTWLSYKSGLQNKSGCICVFEFERRV